MITSRGRKIALCLCDDRHKLLARSDPTPPRLDRRPFCLLSMATPSNRRVLHHVSTGLRLAVWSTAGERGRRPATAGTTLAPGKPLIPPGHERDIRPPTYQPTNLPPTYRRPTTQSDHRPLFASTQEKAPPGSGDFQLKLFRFLTHSDALEFQDGGRQGVLPGGGARSVRTCLGRIPDAHERRVTDSNSTTPTRHLTQTASSTPPPTRRSVPSKPRSSRNAQTWSFLASSR